MLQVLWWIVVLVGVAAASAFLVLHRPRNWFRPAALNATGWILIIWLLYIRSGAIVLMRGGSVQFTSAVDAAFSLGFGAFIDALLIFRVYTFLKYQRTGEPMLNWSSANRKDRRARQRP